jgi:predicted nuclease with TOPRIM domain
VNWPTVLASLIGAGFFGTVGGIVTLILRRPMNRADVTEKLEEISGRALDRMSAELKTRIIELDELRLQVGSLPSLRGRIRELEADLESVRRRIVELETEIARLKARRDAAS